MSLAEAEKFRSDAEKEFAAGKIQDAIINIKAAIIKLNWHVTNALRVISVPRTVSGVRLPQVGRVDIPATAL